MYVMESGSDSGHVFMVLFLRGSEGRKSGVGLRVGWGWCGAFNHQCFFHIVAVYAW